MSAAWTRRLTVAALVAAAGFPFAAAQDTPPNPPPDPPPAAPEFKPPAILAQRRKGLKEPATNAAVAAGLDWLRRHRAKDGSWDADGFAASCAGAKCDGAGVASVDAGVSGLAVLAFLGAGSTPKEGPDAALLADALKYLCDVQDSDGCIGPRSDWHYIYGHATATMAVAEAYWLTGDEKYGAAAAKARDFLAAARNPYLGWRYVPVYGKGDGSNDSSMTAYGVIALRTCEFAGLDVDRGAYKDSLAWLDKMSDRVSGRVGYQHRGGADARCWLTEQEASEGDEPDEPVKPAPPTDPDAPPRPIPRKAPLWRYGAGPICTGSPSDLFERSRIDGRFPDDACSSLTSAAAAAVTLTRDKEAAELVDRWATFVAASPPSVARRHFLDLHTSLFGSLFDAQRPLDVKPQSAEARKSWRPWRDVVVGDLVAAQAAKTAGCAAGSWNPADDPFGAAGGRVYATAMAVLALEAPNRFPKVWKQPARPPVPAKK